MSARARPRWFWPTFAVGLFLVNVGIVGVIIYVAVTQASPVEGPPSNAQAVGGQE